MAVAVYRKWLADPERDLDALLDAAMAEVLEGFVGRGDVEDGTS
jgi:hypothetical protein